MDCELKEKGRMETHRKYIDIQYIVKGSEIIRVLNKKYLKIEEDCTPEKDVIFYEASELSSEIKFVENNFNNLHKYFTTNYRQNYCIAV